ncbi:hypothetical protein NE237_017377 [Protea cynaroides]|uniref:Uncharacterized protein n=1 Tax=Protea cynaroides TaxID=273540 RepID=A0A9Q0K7Y3_9MAGN|nr:hypothetical protein NE237_017377 [Protea cynaroides]
MVASADEQDSSSDDVGGDEVPAATAPQTAVVKMAELLELLSDIRSITLDDQQWIAPVTEGLIVLMPDDVATIASARRESNRRRQLQSVVRVRATYSTDSPDHQDDRGSQHGDL